jgi:uncharacterized protein with HEPN domain
VIGEAVKNLAPETRSLEPDIPWADIAGLRDLIAHEYFRIEIGRVLATPVQVASHPRSRGRT